jgi:hypothetical protein
MYWQAKPSPPLNPLKLQGTTVPKTMKMKTSHSMMPPKQPLLESGQATNQHLMNAVPLDKLLHHFGCGKIEKIKVPKQL